MVMACAELFDAFAINNTLKFPASGHGRPQRRQIKLGQDFADRTTAGKTIFHVRCREDVRPTPRGAENYGSPRLKGPFRCPYRNFFPPGALYPNEARTKQTGMVCGYGRMVSSGLRTLMLSACK